MHPKNVKKNSDAKAGDKLILGKPLGVGVLSAALKQEKLSADGYAAMIANTTKLNVSGRTLSAMPGVHALTDVTGFGLLGHALEMCRGARVSARISMKDVPLIEGVADLAAQGMVTGASGRNWAGYGRDVRLGAAVTDVHKALLTDPQTSGGLLISCAREAADEVLATLRRDGFDSARVIGELSAGEPVAFVD